MSCLPGAPTEPAQERHGQTNINNNINNKKSRKERHGEGINRTVRAVVGVKPQGGLSATRKGRLPNRRVPMCVAVKRITDYLPAGFQLATVVDPETGLERLDTIRAADADSFPREAFVDVMVVSRMIRGTAFLNGKPVRLNIWLTRPTKLFLKFLNKDGKLLPVMGGLSIAINRSTVDVQCQVVREDGSDVPYDANNPPDFDNITVEAAHPAFSNMSAEEILNALAGQNNSAQPQGGYVRPQSVRSTQRHEPEPDNYEPAEADPFI